MPDELVPESGRLEQILESVEHFKSITTRRSFMQKIALAGGTAAVAAASLGKVANVFASSNPVLDFVNAAVGAERIGIAFYGNALGSGSPFSVSGDPATHALLNSSHRGYFQAAFNQESSHLAALIANGGSFPFGHFGFPAGMFDNKDRMLAMGQSLESIFIGAYLGAVKAGGAGGASLGGAVTFST